MIGKGFCLICGRRLDADPDRTNDGVQHDDCKRQSFPKTLKHLGVSKEKFMKILHDQYIVTTDQYWDCECLENFIHNRAVRGRGTRRCARRRGSRGAWQAPRPRRPGGSAAARVGRRRASCRRSCRASRPGAPRPRRGP